MTGDVPVMARLEKILRDGGTDPARVPGTAERVVDLLDELSATRCTDPQCVTLRRHNALGPHFWRHEPVPSRGRAGGIACTCGKLRRHRVHKPAARGGS